jgi:L-2-hydroxyglutarate oxidase LhgO
MPSFLQFMSKTKGGGLVPTVDGNILVGPTAQEAPGREDYSTAPSDVCELERHFRINKRLSPSMVITYFAGVRPCTYEEDFVVERSDYVRNLVHAAGMQSPGLAAEPAVARDAARWALSNFVRPTLRAGLKITMPVDICVNTYRPFHFLSNMQYLRFNRSQEWGRGCIQN